MRWSLGQLIGSWRSPTAPRTDEPARPDFPAGQPGFQPTSPGRSAAGPRTSASGPSGEWRDVPPLRRTLPSMPITSRSAFPSSVAGRRSPDPILHPLRHGSASGGPAGLVRAVVVPSQAGLESRPAGVSRPPAAPRADDAASGPGPGRQLAAELHVEPASGEAVVAGVQRRLPVASGRPDGARALTQVTVGPDLGLDRPGRAGRPAPEPSRAPMAEVPPTGSAPGAVSDAPPDGATATRPAPADRLTLGQARRLGLGAPLARVPAGSRAVPSEVERTDVVVPAVGVDAAGHGLVSRKPEPVAAPPVTRARMSRDPGPVTAPVAFPAADVQPASSPGTTGPRVAAGGAAHPLPVLRVRPPAHPTIHSVDVEGGPARAAAAAWGSVPDGPDPPAVVTSARPVEAAAFPAPRGAARASVGSATPATGIAAARPLVGSRGDVRASIQRRTNGGGAPVPDEQRGVAGATSPARPVTGVPDWRHDAAVSSRPARIRRPAPERDEQALQDPGAASARPSGPATGAVPEDPFPFVARVVQRTPGTPATSAPVPGGSLSALNEAARPGSGVTPVPLADRPSPPSFHSGASGSGAAVPTAPGSAGTAVVQRSVTIDEMTTDVEPAPGREHDRESDEQMAGRLYDGIRRRLVADLLLDRERAGLLADMRS